MRYVVPLTNRPHNIYFKTDEDLSKISKSSKDLQIAQLNYSIMMHLGRCLEILNILKSNKEDIFKQRNLFSEGFTVLVGAQDNAFELFERINNPIYAAFDEMDGMRAKEAWRMKDGKPLESIRRYRNNLVHGILQVSIFGDLHKNEIWFAKIGTENKYFDWRIVMDQSENNRSRREKAKEDFFTPVEILSSAFSETIQYLNGKFSSIL